MTAETMTWTQTLEIEATGRSREEAERNALADLAVMLQDYRRQALSDQRIGPEDTVMVSVVDDPVIRSSSESSWSVGIGRLSMTRSRWAAVAECWVLVGVGPSRVTASAD